MTPTLHQLLQSIW